MIVMKFGEASMASPASIRQVAGLVRSHQHRHSVVVVSALAGRNSIAPGKHRKT
jgi:aspartokinase